MSTPRPITSATEKLEGSAKVVTANAMPMPRDNPSKLWNPCLAESATVGCMLTKAPSGA